VVRRAVAVSPDHQGACVGLARALAVTGQTREAEVQLEALLRRNPDCAEAHALLAALRDSAGEPAAALRGAWEGLRVSCTNPLLHVLLARSLLRTEKTAEAIRHYRIALRSDPDSVDALVGLARVLAAHEDRRFRDGAEAVVLAEKACKRTQKPAPQSLRALAAAYAEAGDFPRSLSENSSRRPLAASWASLIAPPTHLSPHYGPFNSC
jgi:cytochrome c-type biogenesis protein CcmH/NrfG